MIYVCTTLPKGNSLPKTAVQTFLHMWPITNNTQTHVKFHCFDYWWLIEIIMCKNFIIAGRYKSQDFTSFHFIFTVNCIHNKKMLYCISIELCVCNLQDQTSKAVSVIIIGCQTKSISPQLKKLLIAKVEKMCEDNPQLCHVNITVRFVSNETLRTNILELRHHLYGVASAVKLSFGKTLYS